MAVLFEYFEDVDLPAERKKAREEGHAEGHAEGLAAGLAEGRAEGLAEGHADLVRFTKLTQLLLESGRTDDLSRAVTDLDYRKELYVKFNL